jgi:predicted nucleotidyltransferase
MHLILDTIVGSHAYGLALPGSDLDRRGIFLAPPDALWAIGGHEKCVTHPTEDTTHWELAHFVGHALKGSHAALDVLWAPVVSITDDGHLLHDARRAFLSRRALPSMRGHAVANIHVVREATVVGPAEWKRLMHAARLALVGETLARTGDYRIDMTDYRDALLALRGGSIPLADALARVEALVAAFTATIADTPLPAGPDVDAVQRVVTTIRARSARAWLDSHGY